MATGETLPLSDATTNQGSPFFTWSDLAPGEAAFWQAQRREAKRRVAEIVAKYHINVNVTESWRTELDPQVNPDPSNARVEELTVDEAEPASTCRFEVKN